MYIPLDEFLPQLVTTKIITITDKMFIAGFSKSAIERCQYFLDHYISKSLSAGDPSALYKLLQIMDASPRCSGLAAKIKQLLKIESMEGNLSDMQNLSMKTIFSFFACTCA